MTYVRVELAGSRFELNKEISSLTSGVADPARSWLDRLERGLQP
jgi:hypothetical protein